MRKTLSGAFPVTSSTDLKARQAQVDCAMEALRKVAESIGGDSHPNPSTLKGLTVGLLRVIERGFMPNLREQSRCWADLSPRTA